MAAKPDTKKEAALRKAVNAAKTDADKVKAHAALSDYFSSIGDTKNAATYKKYSDQAQERIDKAAAKETAKTKKADDARAAAEKKAEAAKAAAEKKANAAKAAEEKKAGTKTPATKPASKPAAGDADLIKKYNQAVKDKDWSGARGYAEDLKIYYEDKKDTKNVTKYEAAMKNATAQLDKFTAAKNAFNPTKASGDYSKAKKEGDWATALKLASQLKDYWAKKGKPSATYDKWISEAKANIEKSSSSGSNDNGGGNTTVPITEEPKTGTTPPSGGKDNQTPPPSSGGKDNQNPPPSSGGKDDQTPGPSDSGDNEPEPPAKEEPKKIERPRPAFVAQKRQYGKGDFGRDEMESRKDVAPQTPAEKAGISGVSRSVGRSAPVKIQSPAVQATPSSSRGPGYEPRKNNFEVGRG